jgi:glycerol-3-phosphate acyltransferase PlsY
VSLAISRYVSLASLLAAAAVPMILTTQMIYTESWNYLLLGFTLILALLMLVRHKANLARIAAGTEAKVWQKKKEASQ